jgi:hypothetical protein
VDSPIRPRAQKDFVAYSLSTDYARTPHRSFQLNAVPLAFGPRGTNNRKHKQKGMWRDEKERSLNVLHFYIAAL